MLQTEQHTASSQQHVSHVLLNVGGSVVDEGVRSKLSESVEELVGVEGRLYSSLDGVLGRNVKRVQDGLKRVREALEKEGRSDAKDDFSTLDKKRKWIEVCECVCACAYSHTYAHTVFMPVCVCTVSALVGFGLCLTQVRSVCRKHIVLHVVDSAALSCVQCGISLYASTCSWQPFSHSANPHLATSLP